MIEDVFDEAVDLVLTRRGGEALQHILEMAGEITAAPVACIAVCRDDEVQVVAASGFARLAPGETLPLNQALHDLFSGPKIWEDLISEPHMAAAYFANQPRGWRWLAVVPVTLPSLRYKVALCCADPRIDVHRRTDMLHALRSVAIASADSFKLLGMVAESRRVADWPDQSAIPGMTGNSPEPPPSDSGTINLQESPAVTTAFLLNTLIEQRRMLRRDSITYHALARWRTPIKQWQIAALRALKADPPEALVAPIASQIADVAREMYGKGMFRLVVPVACGNSGPDCLAYRLGQSVSANLSVPFHEAFAPIATTGKSHPRRNIGRERMQVSAPPREPVLLIDDVATSGAHLEEAVKLLRETAPAVLPLVWIAG